MRDVVAMILAGGQGTRLSVLSEKRAKPAVPFGGKYRIIDFTLSNCVNSGIYTVGVLTQYRPFSLIDHIGIGKYWDLDRLTGGVKILQPYEGREGFDWYKGTADAIYQNLDFIDRYYPEYVIILSGDHIYKMDYNTIITFHKENKADVTISTIEVPWEEANRFGIITIDERGKILRFQEKPPKPESNLASMGIYVFTFEFLKDVVTKDAHNPSSSHDFGKDIIPAIIGTSSVYAYKFNGYWRDVGTIQSYWEANMDLLKDLPPLDLYDPQSIIYTRSEEEPPVKFSLKSKVKRSLLSNGCIVEGEVINSVLSPGVYVEEGAVVKDSIVMSFTRIKKKAYLDRVILDKYVVVGEETYMGYGDDNTPNKLEPDKLNTGITIAGKGAKIPKGLKIGKNVRIDPDVTEGDFPSDAFIKSGETILKK